MPLVDDNASTILVKINDNDQENKVIDQINISGVDGGVYSWREVAGIIKSVSQTFVSINAIMFFVGALIAAVTIFIVIYLDIINKKRQIGILRAIGIKPYIIISSYVILSAVYSVLGLIIGTGLFYLILVPYFNIHPFNLTIVDAKLVLNNVDFLVRAEVVMWVSVLSGLIPAAIVVIRKVDTN